MQCLIMVMEVQNKVSPFTQTCCSQRPAHPNFATPPRAAPARLRRSQALVSRAVSAWVERMEDRRLVRHRTIDFVNRRRLGALQDFFGVW